MELLLMIIARLTQAGYVYIGMDHFALPEDRLVIALQQRHAATGSGYSTHGECDLIGRVLPRLAMWQAITAKTSKCFPSITS